MLKLCQITDKLLHGKLSKLIGRDKENIHPSEVAHILNKLPQKSALQTYIALPEASLLLVFKYLDNYLEQAIVNTLQQKKQPGCSITSILRIVINFIVRFPK